MPSAKKNFSISKKKKKSQTKLKKKVRENEKKEKKSYMNFFKGNKYTCNGTTKQDAFSSWFQIDG